MGYVPTEIDEGLANANLKEHCEKVIKGIKKERALLRGRIQTLAWKQKRYEGILRDINQLPLDLEESE